MNTSPPRVFVSYSHDSKEHKEWVRKFATTLRDGGIDAILDQWDLKIGDDLPEFMEQHLSGADYAIMICTQRYVQKANAGEGGVGYEKMIMTSQLMNKISDSVVIPVIRERGDPPVPTFLKTRLYVDFSDDAELEESFDKLLRFLLNSPLNTKPSIGAPLISSANTDHQDQEFEGLLSSIGLMDKFSEIEDINREAAIHATEELIAYKESNYPSDGWFDVKGVNERIRRDALKKVKRIRSHPTDFVRDIRCPRCQSESVAHLISFGNAPEHEHDDYLIDVYVCFGKQGEPCGCLWTDYEED